MEGVSMKIYHDLQQGSPEWHAIRARNFTASGLGQWTLEPMQITMTVPEIKAVLDEHGIGYKGNAKRDDLIELLPDKERYLELCDGAKTAIIDKIIQGKFYALLSRDEDELTPEDAIWLRRQKELQEQSDRQFGFNIPVKYGKELEPFARDYYAEKTSKTVSEVGFIEHDSGGFGCSPDGICLMGEPYMHGLEIKCPIPTSHIAHLNHWKRTGEIPDQHKLQVHCSMAVTGLSRWDFVSYCPGERNIIQPVYRDETTDKLEQGLKTLVREMAKMKSELAKDWMEEYQQ